MAIKKRIYIFAAISLTLLVIFVGSQHESKYVQIFSTSLLLSDHCISNASPDKEQCTSEKIKVASVLQKPLKYLGKGRHSYAFVSENGRYVLKFFRKNPRNHSWYTRYLPRCFPFSNWRWKKEHCDLKYVVNAYENAFEIDKEGCGIIHTHLSPTVGLWGNTTLIDNHGIRHLVDLDATLFVVQDRATELREVIASHLKNNDIDSAKTALRNVIDLYHDQYTKGCYDWGIGIMHNSGFVGARPVHFDVSKLIVDDSVKNVENQQKDFDRQVKRIQRWLTRHYPEHNQEIIQDVHAKLEELSHH